MIRPTPLLIARAFTARALIALASAGLAAASTAPANAQSQPAPPPATTSWLPRATAELQALDKVYARGRTLTVKVGQSVRFGTLTIAVTACLVRPPDQAADATAFLTITEPNQPTPAFRGWMLATNPALNMLAHPIYDIRLTACRP